MVNRRSDTDLGNTQSAPRGGERATVCFTVTAVGVGVREAGYPGAMRMGRAGGLLVDGTAEEHLRIGALEDAGDAGAPLELLQDDRPDGLMSSFWVPLENKKGVGQFLKQQDAFD